MSGLKCPVCSKEIVAVDAPNGEYYHTEDTMWGIPPQDDHDPGWMVPKPGAIPASQCGLPFPDPELEKGSGI